MLLALLRKEVVGIFQEKETRKSDEQARSISAVVPSRIYGNTNLLAAPTP
jgi:hypothetical protein